MKSRFDANDKWFSRGIKQKLIQRKLVFPAILYMAVFLMMLVAESVVKDKITLMGNEKYLKIPRVEKILQDGKSP